ncbi:hypothetical protein ACFLSA_06800, partial [Bacteroidota bacterium]
MPNSSAPLRFQLRSRLNSLPSAEKIEQQEKELEKQYSEFIEYSNSDELKRYEELDKYFNSEEFT